jgi:glutaconyl-CoA/methylmalonyl-CoA decarboxylase subunit gamma
MINRKADMKYNLAIAGKNFDVDVKGVEKGKANVTVNGVPYEVMIVSAESGIAGAKPAAEAAPVALNPIPPKPVAKPAPAPAPTPKPAVAAPVAAAAGEGALTAPIPGVIMDLKVSVGDTVLAGETVVVLEAMKMENNLVANTSGTVQEILVQKGQQVSTGDVIMIIG